MVKNTIKSRIKAVAPLRGLRKHSPYCQIGKGSFNTTLLK